MRALCLKDTLRYDAAYPDPKPADGEALVAVKLAGICATDLELVKGYMGFTACPAMSSSAPCSRVRGPGAANASWPRSTASVASATCASVALANHCRRRTVLGIDRHDGVLRRAGRRSGTQSHEVPATISDAQAVFVEPVAAALQVIKQFRIEKRMRVAVIGSGRLGLLVAQVLKTTGCDLEVWGGTS